MCGIRSHVQKYKVKQDTVITGTYGGRDYTVTRPANANIKVIIKKGCDHHPRSLEDPTEIVNFMKTNK